jgi:3-isopropylmalate/(R)-2-methylmalate dehydratase small subunit
MSGRAWVFGDDVHTDAIIAAHHLRTSDAAVWAAHVLESERPEFAAQAAEGDVVVAGHSFGGGSSREHAAIALRAVGVRAVVADSFARSFYRNAFNSGLMLLEAPGVRELVSDGDQAEVDAVAGVVRNLRTGAELRCAPVPEFLRAICDAGGLTAWLNASGGWPVEVSGA